MIIYKTGNIFNSNAQVITNTVNCVGVMGKGIALQFKSKFPAMFLDYQKKCENKEVRLGSPYLWSEGQVQILNFPTKGHWRADSNLSDIESGLKYLAENYEKLEINSIALPPLGCGNGGLNWKDVKNLINKYLGSLDLLDVYVYEASEETVKLENEQSAVLINKSNKSKKDDGLAASQGTLF